MNFNFKLKRERWINRCRYKQQNPVLICQNVATVPEKFSIPIVKSAVCQNSKFIRFTAFKSDFMYLLLSTLYEVQKILPNRRICRQVSKVAAYKFEEFENPFFCLNQWNLPPSFEIAAAKLENSKFCCLILKKSVKKSVNIFTKILSCLKFAASIWKNPPYICCFLEKFSKNSVKSSKLCEFFENRSVLVHFTFNEPIL